MGILGAPDVDWSIGLEGGRLDVTPGGVLRAQIGLRPRDGLDARRVMAAFVGTEEYAYEEVDRDRQGSHTRRAWDTTELAKQEVQLLGPTRLGPGEARTLAVEFQVPPNVLPSLESGVLRVRWKLAAWIDVGGRDPQFEQALIVPLTAAALPSMASLGMAEQVQSVTGGQPVGFWAQPAPLRAGQPFSGVVDVTTPLDPGGTRIELKLHVSTLSGSGPGVASVAGDTIMAELGWSNTSRRPVTEDKTLWRGGLSETAPVSGWRRYAFSGQLPLAPIVTATFPHGAASAMLDVVVSRRLRPDQHITRPVAIVTG